MTAIEKADEGLTIQEAADRLGVHHQTMRAWIKRGEVPVTRFGPKGTIVKLHPDDVDALKTPPG